MRNNRFVLELYIISLLIGVGTPIATMIGHLRGTRMGYELSPEQMQAALLRGMGEKAQVVVEPYKALISTPAAIQRGKVLYIEKCALCHGENGDGQGVAGKALEPPPRNFISKTEKWTYGTELKEVFKGISLGSPGTGMVGYKTTLSFEERWALVHYIATLGGMEGRFNPLDEQSAKALYSEIAE